MDIPTVLEIHKYSLPETEIVDSRVKTRLCLQTQQVPTAIQVQPTYVINIEIPEFELVDGVIVKKNKCSKCSNCLKCKNVPIGPIMICVMCLGFLCLVFIDTIRVMTYKSK